MRIGALSAAFMVLCSTLMAQTPTDTTYDFRKIRWGMSVSQVIASELEKPVSESPDVIVFETEIVGFPCGLGYIFVRDTLVRAKYIFSQKHTNRNLYLDDYTKIKQALTKKYGKPKEDDKVWSDDLYKNKPDDWGMAVCVGHLLLHAGWVTPSTNIHLWLSGDNYEVSLQAEYSSLKFGDFEKNNKESKDADGL